MDASPKRTLIVLVGPTAVGKTSLAMQLARHLKTEIVSADSRQVYRELEIGTAKPTRLELISVPHHFINVKSIMENYDAGQYGNEALSLIHEKFETYADLILCGGSGLYIKAVLEGFDEMPVIPDGLRAELVKSYEANGLSWIQEKVKELDPGYFAVVDQLNPHRLIRALEINYASGKSVLEWRKKGKRDLPFSVVKIGLSLERGELYKRIDARMDKMVEEGLFEEASQFFNQRHLPALQTVGYQEIFGFMEGKYSREEALRLLKRNSRNYAKRQLTWFRRDMEITWFEAGDDERILEFVEHRKLTHE